MRPKHPVKVLILAIALTSATFYPSACVKGSVTHKATVGQHTLREAVGAFQDAEIAEFHQGFVPPDTHLRIQTVIQKIAMAAVDLDNSLASGATAASFKAKFDAIYTLLDSLNTDGILGIKNPTTKQTLEVALDGIRAIVDNILVGVK
jgi:hypothetical protein